MKSPRARVVGITTADDVSASPARGPDGRRRRQAHGLTLTSSGGYVGPGCRDARGHRPGDASTRRTSAPPTSRSRCRSGPRCRCCAARTTRSPSSPAGRPRAIDIPTLCHAWLPPGMTLDDVRFETSWEPEPDGVELRSTGAGRRTVTSGPTPRRPDAAPTAGSACRPAVPTRSRTSRRLGHRARQRRPPPASTQRQPPPRRSAHRRMRPFAVTGLEGRFVADDQPARPTSTRRWRSPPAPSTRRPSPAGKGLTVSRSGCNLTVTASGDGERQGHRRRGRSPTARAAAPPAAAPWRCSASPARRRRWSRRGRPRQRRHRPRAVGAAGLRRRQPRHGIHGEVASGRRPVELDCTGLAVHHRRA